MIGWSEEKNDQLKAERGIDLAVVATLIEAGDILAVLPNPGHPGQVLVVVTLNGFTCACPSLPHDGGYFLKTAYFSRKLHHRFTGG